MSALDHSYATAIALEATLLAFTETPIIASKRLHLKEAAALRRQLRGAA